MDDQRIDDAVMTSSAFPGAFGSKHLQYCRLSSFAAIDEENTGVQVKPQPPAAEVVCPEGYKLEQAEFADGGLFDNLPIGLARVLAEQHKLAGENVLPVTYVYLDPDRLRYDVPSPADTWACASDDPPEACQIMNTAFLASRLYYWARWARLAGMNFTVN